MHFHVQIIMIKMEKFKIGSWVQSGDGRAVRPAGVGAIALASR
jgi:hypothetical protein